MRRSIETISKDFLDGGLPQLALLLELSILDTGICTLGGSLAFLQVSQRGLTSLASVASYGSLSNITLTSVRFMPG